MRYTALHFDRALPISHRRSPHFKEEPIEVIHAFLYGLLDTET